MGEEARAINRRHLGQEITGILRSMILKGELSPNERLVETKLAGSLGTSRTPVREALHRLAQEGLLSKRDKGGYEVRPLSTREIEEAIGIRAVLESYAAELAASHINPQSLLDFEHNLAEFKDALDRGDQTTLVELNTQFHNLLYQAAQSDLLVRLVNELADTLFRFRQALLADSDAGQKSFEAHRALIGALKKRDMDLAGRLSRDHIREGGEWILSRIEQGDLEL